MAPDRRRIDRLARQNHSVLTRVTLEGLGVSTTWIRAQVDNRIWRRAYPGVYITHSGPPTWDTRTTAALAYAGKGAALSHATAADWWFENRAARSQRVANTVELSVPAVRTIASQRGLRIHRRRTFPDVWEGRIRVVTAAETAVDLACQARSEDDVVGVLARAVRIAEPSDIRAAVARRSRVRRRDLLLDVLGDVSAGMESPLERHYHQDVEVDHGLPSSELQVREMLSDSRVRADCRYRRWRVRVELDGQLGHPGGRTDRDTWRDNAALLATSEVTLRYRWSHVVGTPCRTAQQVVDALRAGGWDGRPPRCGRPGCTVR
jgi:hypothetical protein